MNDSKSGNNFKPKQAMAPTPEHYNMLVGNGMQKLAEISLAQCPTIQANANIHDNGCGTGASTAAIMTTVAPETAASITITATDILEAAVNAYRERATAGSWPSEAVVMDANKLSFADETFSHSFGSALLFAGPQNNGIGAIKEMYRTLQPGGILIVNSLAHTPTIGPVTESSRATRPKSTPLPRQDVGHWADPAFLSGIVEEGGFEKEKIKVQQCEYFATTPDFEVFPSLLWSFIGGTTTAGWSVEDELKWDQAVHIVKEELQKTQGFRLNDDGTAQIRFVANVAVAIK
ncbi:S-adenosyl-L-methionine-dependent methyltransferase [Xylariales sp. PMI_506]|nr:S-adenosyl-L-methionine-dependent methyltransferase [Xylariales sp. PMI_506]